MQLPLASRKGRTEGLFLLLGLVVAGFFAYWAWTSPGGTQAPPPDLALPSLEQNDPFLVVAPIPPRPAPAPAPDRPPLPPDSSYHNREALDSQVRGRILLPDWAPEAGTASVTLSPQSDEGEILTRTLLLPEREFHFPGLAFGSWALHATAGEFKSGKILLTTSSKVPDHFITLPLEPDTVILGQVLDQVGARVIGISVHARMVPAEGVVTNFPVATATTEDDGFFRLTGLRQGLWEVSPGTPRNPLADPLRLHLAGSEARLDLRVGILGAARIAVLEKKSLARVDAARIVARLVHGTTNRAGHGASATTGEDGMAILPHLPVGDYVFTVFAPDHRRTVLRGRVESGVTLELGVHLPRTSATRGGL